MLGISPRLVHNVAVTAAIAGKKTVGATAVFTVRPVNGEQYLAPATITKLSASVAAGGHLGGTFQGFSGSVSIAEDDVPDRGDDTAVSAGAGGVVVGVQGFPCHTVEGSAMLLDTQVPGFPWLPASVFSRR